MSVNGLQDNHKINRVGSLKEQRVDVGSLDELSVGYVGSLDALGVGYGIGSLGVGQGVGSGHDTIRQTPTVSISRMRKSIGYCDIEPII
jgi:hypothetical protein